MLPLLLSGMENSIFLLFPSLLHTLHKSCYGPYIIHKLFTIIINKKNFRRNRVSWVGSRSSTTNRLLAPNTSLDISN